MQKDDKEKQEEILKEYAESQETPQTPPQHESQESPAIGPKLTEVKDAKMPWERKQYDLGNQLGWIPMSLDDLPTRGLFYPKESSVAIRSATGAEIRHWSTLQDDPTINPNYYSDLDDKTNYIIERCVTIKATNPETGVRYTWKDIKEVDRFYLLLSIHELTFPAGENKLQVKVSETTNIDVKKDMVSYVTLDPELMKYYNEDERCFIFKLKTGRVLKLDLPSIGVTQWLKHYIIRMQNEHRSIDTDFLIYAPFIIRHWLGLSDTIYQRYVEDSMKWDVATISLLAYVKKLFSDTVEPVIRFTDERGMEQIAPLNFQGGIKSLFIIPHPFGQLE